MIETKNLEKLLDALHRGNRHPNESKLPDVIQDGKIVFTELRNKSDKS